MRFPPQIERWCGTSTFRWLIVSIPVWLTAAIAFVITGKLIDIFSH